MKLISFVIACYNSEKSLQGVVEEVVDTISTIDSYDYEIILVNDSSKDGTLNIIKSLCQSNSKVKGIHLSKNFGQQAAMMAGFRASKGDLVAYSDDDGQSPVSDLQKFLDEIDRGVDMVWANFEKKENHFLKNLGSDFNDYMVCKLFKKPKDLYFGNFWVARKFVIDQAVMCTNPFPYLGGIFLKTTTNMSNVMTTHRKRMYGQSTYTFRKLVSVWLNGFTAFSVAPLRFASFVGFLISVFGFIFMAYLVVMKLLNPSIAMGYSSIMSTLLFLGGMIMLMLGMLGEYIGRIYININSVPQYVIKDRLNHDEE